MRWPLKGKPGHICTVWTSVCFSMIPACEGDHGPSRSSRPITGPHRDTHGDGLERNQTGLQKDHQWPGLAAIGKGWSASVKHPTRPRFEDGLLSAKQGAVRRTFSTKVGLRQTLGRRRTDCTGRLDTVIMNEDQDRDPIGPWTPQSGRFSATWRSTPCRRRYHPKAPCAESSSEPAGTMHFLTSLLALILKCDYPEAPDR